MSIQQVEFIHPSIGRWEVLKRRLELELIKTDLNVSLLESLDDSHDSNGFEGDEPNALIKLADNRVFQRNDFFDDEAFVKRVVQEIRLLRRSSGAEILVPIDLSEASVTAFQYALSLARLNNYSLRIIHFLAPIPDPNLDGVTYFNNDLEIDRRRVWEDFVQALKTRFAADIEDLKGLLRHEFIIGKAQEVLIDQSRNLSTIMIVLGSTGAGKMLKSWFGSVSTHVALNAACPTIIVPRETIFQPFRKILLAVDRSNPEPSVLNAIRSTLGALNAKVQAVQIYAKANVYASDANELIQTDEVHGLEELILFKKDVFEGLNEFALQNKVDLITVIRRQRPLLQRLFHHSVSHELAANSAIPLMVIHEGDIERKILPE